MVTEEWSHYPRVMSTETRFPDGLILILLISWFQETRDASKVAGLFAKHFQAVVDSQAERRRKIRTVDYVPHYTNDRFNVPLGIVDIERSTPATRLLPNEVTKVFMKSHH